MLKVCLAVCGDLTTAEEAVQSAWALAWRRLPSLRDSDRLRPWLVSIAANQARDMFRRQRRRPVVELDVADSDAGAGDPAGRSGDIDLRNAMARLDPTDRALVALR
jgi:RNA polymerase sigma-70 factor (ECF subfamily)